MKPYKIFGLVFLSVVLVFLLVPAFLPSSFEVSRTAVIQRNASMVYQAIYDFKTWEKWSPWRECDSSIISTYTGAPNGEGAQVKWVSEKSGSGEMSIIAARPDSLLLIKLSINEFAEFESKFLLTEKNGTTTVRWSDSGTMGYLERWLILFAETMMGNDLSQGLEKLKLYVEAQPISASFVLSPIEMAETNPIRVYSLIDSCAPENIGKKLNDLYATLLPFLQKNKMESLGAPMAVYYSYTDKNVILEAAIPVAENKVKPEGKIMARTLPAASCISASLFGDYKYLSQGFVQMIDSINAYGYEFVGPQFDIYITDPTTVKSPSDIETKMFFPVK